MQFFDLHSFIDRAFRRDTGPEHPLQDEAAARHVFLDLPPGDDAAGLAEVTHWVLTMNETDSFTPGRRARVLMELDDPVRDLWRSLGARFLAPGGKPSVRRDGDPTIPKALLESAAQFSQGYALCIEGEERSRWVQQNMARLALRRMRWLGRRLTLANMLHRPEADELWVQARALYTLAASRGIERTVLPVFAGDPHRSTVKLEYVRLLLLDVAHPDGLLGREVELVYRIAQRVAPSALLEHEAPANAMYAVPASGHCRPVLGRSRDHWSARTLFLDSSNCLTRLRGMLERDMGADPSDPDTLFGAEYTVGERQDMLTRLISLWGLDPPRRRSKRVPLQVQVRLQGGLHSALSDLPVFDQGGWAGDSESGADAFRIQLDHDAGAARKQSSAAAIQRCSARVVDASETGLALAVARANAAWARLGLLVAVDMGGSQGWVVAVIRRISGADEELRLGLLVLARRPQAIWCKLEKVQGSSPWDGEAVREREFLDHFQHAILVDAHGSGAAALISGELLIDPRLASPGARFDVPLAKGMARVQVTDIRETGADFCRAAFVKMAPPAKAAG